MIRSTWLSSTDSHIISLIKNEETRREGFSLLVDEYQERVYWQVRKLVNSHEDAADVTQDIWTKVVRYIEGFKEDSALYTWLYRITHNEVINFLKKKKMPSHVLSNVKLSEQENGPDEDDIWEALMGALKDLPERQRQVFELRYFEEMTYADMSELLSLSQGSLKASYHLAVKKIEAYVKKVSW